MRVDLKEKLPKIELVGSMAFDFVNVRWKTDLKFASGSKLNTTKRTHDN
jgi:hypothetical protein